MTIKLMVLCAIFVGCGYAPRFQREQAVVVNSSSGFKIDRYVITANHVADEPFVYITESCGKKYPGLVIDRDTVNDIALILVHDTTYWKYSVAKPHLREKVYTIANPMGLAFSEMQGEIQNLRREAETGAQLIQIGIDVFYGSSGSPVFNSNGELIGMIVSAHPGTRFTFIVPIQKIISLIEKIKIFDYGTVQN